MTRISAFKLASATGAALLAATLLTSAADARIGGGGSFGSRGGRTYQSAPPTSVAPRSAAPITRSETPYAQPSAPSPIGSAATRPSFGSRLGTGLAAGLLGAGLFGMLTGGGFFGGIGGMLSMLGFLIQIGLIVAIGMLAFRFFRGRSRSGLAYAGGAQSGPAPQPAAYARTGAAPGGSGRAPDRDALGLSAADFDAFQRVLADINTAYGREDMAALRRLATPEMAGYFAQEIAANESRGVVNRTSNATLLQGDLSEAWREGAADYATVAMRFSLVDATVDRRSGKVLDGSLDQPQEVSEMWTFRRDRGGEWVLSAIQQV